MTGLAADAEPFRPAVPAPRTRPAGIFEFLWLSWRDPLRIWSERHFDLPVLYGESRLGRAMTVSDPAGLRTVLVDEAANFHKDGVQRRVLGPLLGEGLFLAEDDDWRVMRRILAPTFTPRRIAASAPKMAQIARARVGTWGDVVDVDQQMTRLTFEILSATLFSDALGGEAEDFEAALNAYIGRAARIDPLDVLGAPSWIPRVGRLMAGGAGAFFERRVKELAVERRRTLQAGGDLPDDLLNAQDPETGAGLTDRQVASNILTFILAGHETTARALGWTLYLLARSPRHQALVQREAADFDLAHPDRLEALVWTRACFEEAMRLFPPAPLFTRVALKATKVAGRHVPAGTAMLISPWVLHRHRKLWEDPAAFRPERFLPEAREAIDRFAYLPFGGGPRICIGAAFAMQEALIALAAVTKAVDLGPADAAEPLPAHRITLRPQSHIRLNVVRRDP
ncbi:MAG: cytochrome [Caulobacteraceae bacterium]|nr:cytochrome [Caulobacteraceae bacterium]